MGSVKDLVWLEPAFENRLGVGRFPFSDRYSVFDWGEMPDNILKKGSALAVMAAFNFEELEKRRIRTHYQGLVTADGKLIRFSDLEEGSDGLNVMQVSMAVRYDPIARRFWDEKEQQPRIEYDYSFFDANRGKLDNYLIGLEIIFRNGLPLGSSVFKRIKEAKGEGDPDERERKLQAIYSGLGVTSEPKPDDMLPKPVLNYTTKLEPGDRNLDEDEAYFVSGLPEQVFARVPILALGVNNYITERAEMTGLDPHWDGKAEMVHRDGKLMIADVVGTLDEDRFGKLVSKELLRQWYIKNQPEFPAACDEWKKTGEGWQEKCDVKPVNLPPELSALVSQMYMASCNQYVGKRIFNVPELGEVMEKLQPYR